MLCQPRSVPGIKKVEGFRQMAVPADAAVSRTRDDRRGQKINSILGVGQLDCCQPDDTPTRCSFPEGARPARPAPATTDQVAAYAGHTGDRPHDD